MITHRLSTVLAYRHPGVCVKLVEDLGITTNTAERLFKDTLRFLALAGVPRIRAKTMALATEMGYTVNRVHVCIAPTRLIDEAWHRFVLFTHDYARFCTKHFGEFLHHQPIANPAQLENVVRGDDLIRLARHVYGIHLDLTNWRGDSTNSGTCCIGESADCDVCSDSGAHCYACCACTVCTSFHDALTAAHRARQDAENRYFGVKHMIERPLRELEGRVHDREWRLAIHRSETMELERRLHTVRKEIAKCESGRSALECEIGELKEEISTVRAKTERDRMTKLPPHEEAAARLKTEFDQLLRAHRRMLKRQPETRRIKR
ncbi:hypothetical protein HY480_00005 [Candidatus Uhrbacteria bacterium]|nr:hypothetical protein [Candidatus Uhrbacteria bacterium]